MCWGIEGGDLVVPVNMVHLLHWDSVLVAAGVDCRDGLAHWHHLHWLHILDTS